MGKSGTASGKDEQHEKSEGVQLSEAVEKTGTDREREIDEITKLSDKPRSQEQQVATAARRMSEDVSNSRISIYFGAFARAGGTSEIQGLLCLSAMRAPESTHERIGPAQA